MKIIIEPYNNDWINQFETIKIQLTKIINVDFNIEHIGSTSVKGLGAKPIIDIMIGLKDFENADKLIPNFKNIGYEYVSTFENIFPNRRFFILEKNEIRYVHVHMIEYQSEFWNRHIRFRNHLRSNEIDRENYHQLKLELAKIDWKERGDYANAKSDFIQKLDAKILSII